MIGSLPLVIKLGGLISSSMYLWVLIRRVPVTTPRSRAGTVGLTVSPSHRPPMGEDVPDDNSPEEAD